MALRASKRVANKKANAGTADIAKKKAQRMSVGGALGLTPRKPKARTYTKLWQKRLPWPPLRGWMDLATRNHQAQEARKVH